METPKPQAPVKKDVDLEKVNANIRPSQTVIDAIKAETPKPKSRPQLKAPYTPKNQPLKNHPGLVALKNNLEQR